MLIELITSEFIETLFGIFVSLVPCCVPPLRSGPLAALRLEVRGRKKKKKKEKERSLVATTSALHAQCVCACTTLALISCAYNKGSYRCNYTWHPGCAGGPLVMCCLS